MPTSAVHDRLTALIRDHYVFPDVAEQIVADLDPAHPDGDGEQVPEQLTARIQAVNHDRHLRVRHRATGALEGTTDWEAHYAADAVRNAGGMRRVERVDEHTGLLAIAPYLSPVHLAERHVTAAFALLAGIEHLIIDLREGRGGTPETVALICGYLFGDEPVHLQDIVDRDGGARQYWTSPAAGRLEESVRVHVLISERTFSGCEELAYDLQALDRATVVGQRSRGGAHPVEIFRLTADLELTVPVARSVNAVTATNWEQVGVVPDLDCDPDAALERVRHLRT